jgi:hypothetical protein
MPSLGPVHLGRWLLMHFCLYRHRPVCYTTTSHRRHARAEEKPAHRHRVAWQKYPKGLYTAECARRSAWVCLPSLLPSNTLTMNRGYFPNHESPTMASRPHPFHPRTTYPDSPTMSSTSSLAASPASDTPKLHFDLLTPTLLNPAPAIPEPLLRPTGKYHPSNYKFPSTTTALTPSLPARPLPPTNFTLPPSLQNRKNKDRDRPANGHVRKTSDVKRKLQQYQREMIAQARMSAHSIAAKTEGGKTEPLSPRLLPAGSPGPITPLELEMDGEDGYLVAGGRARRG